MKSISTRTHGIMDYTLGAILILAPWLFGFAASGAETWMPVFIGAGVIVYSLFTDYEMGLFHQISVEANVTLDAVCGIFLALSPWLFGFAAFVWLPHLVFGIAGLLVSMMARGSLSIFQRRPGPA